MVRLIQGKDRVIRGVRFLHKGHTIEPPLQLVSPLEIRAVETIVQPLKGRKEQIELRSQRPRRTAA